MILKGLPEQILEVVRRAWVRILKAARPIAYLQSIVSCEKRLAARPKIPPPKPVPVTTKFQEEVWAKDGWHNALKDLCKG